MFAQCPYVSALCEYICIYENIRIYVQFLGVDYTVLSFLPLGPKLRQLKARGVITESINGKVSFALRTAFPRFAAGFMSAKGKAERERRHLINKWRAGKCEIIGARRWGFFFSLFRFCRQMMNGKSIGEITANISAGIDFTPWGLQRMISYVNSSILKPE